MLEVFKLIFELSQTLSLMFQKEPLGYQNIPKSFKEAYEHSFKPQISFENAFLEENLKQSDSANYTCLQYYLTYIFQQLLLSFYTKQINCLKQPPESLTRLQVEREAIEKLTFPTPNGHPNLANRAGLVWEQLKLRLELEDRLERLNFLEHIGKGFFLLEEDKERYYISPLTYFKTVVSYKILRGNFKIEELVTAITNDAKEILPDVQQTYLLQHLPKLQQVLQLQAQKYGDSGSILDAKTIESSIIFFVNLVLQQPIAWNILDAYFLYVFAEERQFSDFMDIIEYPEISDFFSEIEKKAKEIFQLKQIQSLNACLEYLKKIIQKSASFPQETSNRASFVKTEITKLITSIRSNVQIKAALLFDLYPPPITIEQTAAFLDTINRLTRSGVLDETNLIPFILTYANYSKIFSFFINNIMGFSTINPYAHNLETLQGCIDSLSTNQGQKIPDYFTITNRLKIVFDFYAKGKNPVNSLFNYMAKRLPFTPEMPINLGFLFRMPIYFPYSINTSINKLGNKLSDAFCVASFLLDHLFQVLPLDADTLNDRTLIESIFELHQYNPTAQFTLFKILLDKLQEICLLCKDDADRIKLLEDEPFKRYSLLRPDVVEQIPSILLPYLTIIQMIDECLDSDHLMTPWPGQALDLSRRPREEDFFTVSITPRKLIQLLFIKQILDEKMNHLISILSLFAESSEFAGINLPQCSLGSGTYYVIRHRSKDILLFIPLEKKDSRNLFELEDKGTTIDRGFILIINGDVFADNKEDLPPEYLSQYKGTINDYFSSRFTFDTLKPILEIIECHDIDTILEVTKYFTLFAQKSSKQTTPKVLSNKYDFLHIHKALDCFCNTIQPDYEIFRIETITKEQNPSRDGLNKGNIAIIWTPTSVIDLNLKVFLLLSYLKCRYPNLIIKITCSLAEIQKILTTPTRVKGQSLLFSKAKVLDKKELLTFFNDEAISAIITNFIEQQKLDIGDGNLNPENIIEQLESIVPHLNQDSFLWPFFILARILVACEDLQPRELQSLKEIINDHYKISYSEREKTIVLCYYKVIQHREAPVAPTAEEDTSTQEKQTVIEFPIKILPYGILDIFYNIVDSLFPKNSDIQNRQIVQKLQSFFPEIRSFLMEIPTESLPIFHFKSSLNNFLLEISNRDFNLEDIIKQFSINVLNLDKDSFLWPFVALARILECRNLQPEKLQSLKKTINDHYEISYSKSKKTIVLCYKVIQHREAPAAAAAAAAAAEEDTSTQEKPAIEFPIKRLPDGIWDICYRIVDSLFPTNSHTQKYQIVRELQYFLPTWSLSPASIFRLSPSSPLFLLESSELNWQISMVNQEEEKYYPTLVSLRGQHSLDYIIEAMIHGNTDSETCWELLQTPTIRTTLSDTVKQLPNKKGINPHCMAAMIVWNLRSGNTFDFHRDDILYHEPYITDLLLKQTDLPLPNKMPLTMTDLLVPNAVSFLTNNIDLKTVYTSLKNPEAQHNKRQLVIVLLFSIPLRPSLDPLHPSLDLTIPKKFSGSTDQNTIEINLVRLFLSHLRFFYQNQTGDVEKENTKIRSTQLGLRQEKDSLVPVTIENVSIPQLFLKIALNFFKFSPLERKLQILSFILKLPFFVPSLDSNHDLKKFFEILVDINQDIDPKYFCIQDRVKFFVYYLIFYPTVQRDTDEHIIFNIIPKDAASIIPFNFTQPNADSPLEIDVTGTDDSVIAAVFQLTASSNSQQAFDKLTYYALSGLFSDSQRVPELLPQEQEDIYKLILKGIKVNQNNIGRIKPKLAYKILNKVQENVMLGDTRYSEYYQIFLIFTLSVAQFEESIPQDIKEELVALLKGSAHSTEKDIKELEESIVQATKETIKTIFIFWLQKLTSLKFNNFDMLVSVLETYPGPLSRRALEILVDHLPLPPIPDELTDVLFPINADSKIPEDIFTLFDNGESKNFNAVYFAFLKHKELKHYKVLNTFFDPKLLTLYKTLYGYILPRIGANTFRHLSPEAQSYIYQQFFKNLKSNPRLIYFLLPYLSKEEYITHFIAEASEYFREYTEEKDLPEEINFIVLLLVYKSASRDTLHFYLSKVQRITFNWPTHPEIAIAITKQILDQKINFDKTAILLEYLLWFEFDEIKESKEQQEAMQEFVNHLYTVLRIVLPRQASVEYRDNLILFFVQHQIIPNNYEYPNYIQFLLRIRVTQFLLQDRELKPLPTIPNTTQALYFRHDNYRIRESFQKEADKPGFSTMQQKDKLHNLTQALLDFFGINLIPNITFLEQTCKNNIGFRCSIAYIIFNFNIDPQIRWDYFILCDLSLLLPNLLEEPTLNRIFQKIFDQKDRGAKPLPLIYKNFLDQKPCDIQQLTSFSSGSKIVNCLIKLEYLRRNAVCPDTLKLENSIIRDIDDILKNISFDNDSFSIDAAIGKLNEIITEIGRFHTFDITKIDSKYLPSSLLSKIFAAIITNFPEGKSCYMRFIILTKCLFIPSTKKIKNIILYQIKTLINNEFCDKLGPDTLLDHPVEMLAVLIPLINDRDLMNQIPTADQSSVAAQPIGQPDSTPIRSKQSPSAPEAEIQNMPLILFLLACKTIRDNPACIKNNENLVKLLFIRFYRDRTQFSNTSQLIFYICMYNRLQVAAYQTEISKNLLKNTATGLCCDILRFHPQIMVMAINILKGEIPKDLQAIVVEQRWEGDFTLKDAIDSLSLPAKPAVAPTAAAALPAPELQVNQGTPGTPLRRPELQANPGSRKLVKKKKKKKTPKPQHKAGSGTPAAAAAAANTPLQISPLPPLPEVPSSQPTANAVNGGNNTTSANTSFSSANNGFFGTCRDYGVPPAPAHIVIAACPRQPK